MNKADLLKKLESIKAGIDKAPANAKPLMQKAIDNIESQIAELDKEGNVKPEAKAKAGRPKGTTKPKAEKEKRGRGRPAKKVVEKAPEEKPVTEVQINKVAKDIREEGEPMIRARKRAKKALTEIKEVAKETKQMESKGTLTKSKILAEIKKLNKVFANLGVDIVVESADDLFRDATRTALPKGRRVSKNGKEYYESRPNRSDSLQGTAVYPKLKLAEGGEVEKPMVGTYEGKDAIKGNVSKIGFFTAENGTHIELVGKRDGDSSSGMMYYVAINGRGLYAREYREDAYELYRDEIEKYRKKYAKGGMVDLFDDYENMPLSVAKIVERYQDEFGEDMDYQDTQNMLKEVEAVGYTFEFGLDNEPYGLRPIGTPLNALMFYEDADDDYEDDDYEDYDDEDGDGSEREYLVVCQDRESGEQQEFEVYAEDEEEAREMALSDCDFKNPKIISVERYAKGGQTNYLKKWEVIYITMQGKKGKKEITLGRMSDRDDVKNQLKRMDLNIREVISIKEVYAKGGRTYAMPEEKIIS
jgi:hypothetical protein